MPFPPVPSGLQPRINGVSGAYLQPIRYGRNESGNYELYLLKGTEAEIMAQASAYASIIGISYEVTELPGNLWQLEVRFPYNADGLVSPATDYVESWEFFRQDHEKDLLECIDKAGIIATLTKAQISFIRNKIQNPPQGTSSDPPVAITDFAALDDPDGTPTNQTNAFIVYGLMQRGVRSYAVHVPMLRHTVITSSQYATQASFVNAGKLYSTASLIFDFDIPSGLLFNVAALNDTSSDPDLIYGWLKGYPTVNEVALLKYQIVQEFSYGWWAKLLYPDII